MIKINMYLSPTIKITWPVNYDNGGNTAKLILGHFFLCLHNPIHDTMPNLLQAELTESELALGEAVRKILLRHIDISDW